MKSTVGQGAASVDLKHYSQKKRYNNRRTLVLAIKGRREVIVIREQRHYITRIFWDPPPLYCLIVLLPILSTVLYPDDTYLVRAQYGLFRCVLMFGKGRQGGFGCSTSCRHQPPWLPTGATLGQSTFRLTYLDRHISQMCGPTLAIGTVEGDIYNIHGSNCW